MNKHLDTIAEIYESVADDLDKSKLLYAPSIAGSVAHDLDKLDIGIAEAEPIGIFISAVACRIIDRMLDNGYYES